MHSIRHYASPLGGITLAADEQGLTGLWFDGQKYFADTLPADHEVRTTPILAQACEWLDRYFAGRDPGFTPPLHLEGSPFRTAVWHMLLEIPYGRTTTYGELARRIARERGGGLPTQAVGGAVGHNPVSLIVPCHRVVGSHGSLTGYAGGIDRKVRLLALEGVPTGELFVPARSTAP